MTFLIRHLVAVVAIALFALGCAGREKITCSPGDLSGCVVDDVVITGNDALGDGEIEEKIATAETGGPLENVPLFGAIDAINLEYERFDRFVLERDLQRVARLYRAKGYYKAIVRAGRVRRIDERRSDKPEDVRVLVEIVVEEGMPTRVRKVDLTLKDWTPAGGDSRAGASMTNAKNGLAPGDVFTEEAYESTRTKIQRALTDRGYAYARVEASAKIDLQSDENKDDAADVLYTVEVGPKCTFGEITIEGLESIPEWQIRPSLGFEEGDRYSTRKLEEAEIALSDFGVFGSIEITPQLSKTDPKVTKVPIKVVARPGALKSVRLGGGIELGGTVATHAIAGWQHKNLFGALDRFNVEARPRLVAYPLKLRTIVDPPEDPRTEGEIRDDPRADPRAVPEVVARLGYSLPIPYDPRTVAFVQGQGSVGLERNHDIPDIITEKTNIPGEYGAEQRVGVERRFFLSRLLVGLAHNLSYAQPFSYNLDVTPPGKEALLVSYLQHYAEIDLRRGEDGKFNRINPARGVLAGFDLQMAGFFVGGDASDVKIRPEIRFFAPVASKVVIAGRFTMGFLYTHNYGNYVLDTNPSTDVIQAEAGVVPNQTLLANVNRDVQILTKRGLFSGGPQSNRGYSYNEIAPHRVLGDLGEVLADPDAIGGRTLWEASIELRFPVIGDLGGTVFVDASDVTKDLGELRIDHPHISTGLGVRYDTPVGPLRLDLGFRIPYLQVIGEETVESCIKREVPCPVLIIDEGDAGNFLNIPAAPIFFFEPLSISGGPVR
ncbi:MAG: BamA/TamA family outer membrane protein [Polyangiaceae bacterium]|nr:BamA/TamA family outer membrane protein [Polyangiaceae bacterium]